MARVSEPRQAVTGSAVVVDLSRPVEIKRQAAARQGWQPKAWTYYAGLPEVRYPANFVGSAMSRFIPRVGILDPNEPTAVPVSWAESGKKRKPKWVSIAEEILLGLTGSQGGAPEIQARYGVDMNVSADGWLLGTDPDDDDEPTDWEFLSTDELQFHEKEGKLRAFRDREGTGIDPTRDEPLPEDGVFYRRFWRPHPQFSSRADGALESLQDDCERLMALNDSISARIMSRLAQAGILFIPSGIQLPIMPAGIADPDESDANKLFVKRLLAYFEASILNRKSAAGAMPIPLIGPDDLGEKIRHITMDRAIDETELQLRAETRDTIARGQDLPPEVQTGLKDASHWTTWSVMDSSFRNHLQPLADKYADGLTRVYLRPACKAAFEAEGQDPVLAKQLVVLMDGSNVVSRPNEAEDGRQLHDRIAISDSALRRRSGAADAEEPEPEEYVRILGRQINDPYLATLGMDIQKTIDWDKVGAAGAKEGAPGVGGTPTSRRPADSSDPAGAPGQTKSSTAGGVGRNGAQK